MRARGRSCRGRSVLALGLMLVAAGPRGALAAPPDPLALLLHRMDGHFRHQVPDSIRWDPRYPLNPPELVRLSVTCQLLAYSELCAVDPVRNHYEALVSRADFLVGHFDTLLSRTAFDGMMGYALLGAYEVTGDERYLGAGSLLTARAMRLRGKQNTLNWGLMSAMALARFHGMTGIPSAAERARQILAGVEGYQHPDGSFPHYCRGSKDASYTSWMGMELILIKRHVDDPAIDRMLQGIGAFLAQRVGADGRTSYQEPCPDEPDCWRYYYSLATGCLDYDTRGYCNELATNAMVFDYFAEPKYTGVMGFLYSLEDHGTFPDKWDYFPTPDDPIYIWGGRNPSVIRTSLIFWDLASIYRARREGHPRYVNRRRGPELERAVALFTAEAAEVNATGASDSERLVVAREFDAEPPVHSWVWPTVDSLVIADGDESAVCSRIPAPRNALRPAQSPLPSPTLAAGADGPTGGETRAPTVARLQPITPNPTATASTAYFSLVRGAEVTILVYDAGGRLVRDLSPGRLAAGEHRVLWDLRDAGGRRCAPGLYLVHLRADQEVSLAKLLIVR